MNTKASEGKQVQPDEPVILALKNVSVSFGMGERAIPVTNDVGFVLRRGETLALVGESGSGKSVTAMSVLGLLPGNAHVSGSIRYHDVELLGSSETVLRATRGSRIAMVFQEPMTALNPVYTVGTLIGEALQSHRGSSRANVHNRTLELLHLVGMPDPENQIDYYPHQLSGGQRQRAMIAMAISGNPEILIADEPTTALDVTVQAEILSLLKSLQNELGMAMIFITHDMGVVAEVADRVCVMRAGHIVEEADVFDLFSNPKKEYTRTLLAAVPRLGGGAKVSSGQVAEETRSPISALLVKDLTIRYPGRFGSTGFTAVNNVSFEVPRGEIVGLVGESGSGKSTIGRAVIGLVGLTTGRIEVGGQDLSRLRGRELRLARQALSIVFQDPASSLNPRATIGQSVVEPLNRYGLVRGRKALRSRARELLDSVRLQGSWIDRYPHELSGGQRQRVGIARAISLKPALLVADEPTSALDVSVQASVLQLLQELQCDLGFSCLFISHDLAVVEILADRVVVLRRGEIVEEGGILQVFRHPVKEYTKSLLASSPVPDPHVQKQRAHDRQVIAAR